MARELAAAPSAPPSTAASARRRRSSARSPRWLVDVLNVITGNLDRAGGAMFPRAAAGRAQHAGRARPRPRRHASGAGRRACAACRRASASCRSPCLAEEIETPGEGQIRALITLAGNPALSTPNSGRLEAALDDARLHGRVRPLRQRDDAPRRRHPAAAVAARSARTTTSPSTSCRRATSRTTRRAVLPLEPGQQDEWRTLLRLAGVVAGQGPDVDVDAFDRLVASEVAPPRGRRTPRRCWPSSSRASARSGCST